MFKLNILFDFFLCLLKYLAAVLGGKLFFAGSKLLVLINTVKVIKLWKCSVHIAEIVLKVYLVQKTGMDLGINGNSSEQ